MSALPAIFLVALTLSVHAPVRAESASALSSAERTHIEEVLRGLPRGTYLGRIAVSPDGKRLAWVQGTPGGAEILLAPLDDLAKKQMVTAAQKGERCDEGAMTWSPDSSEIAFLSDCASDGQYDLYISHLDGRPAHRLTELKGFAHAPEFSPDGKEIGFLYVPGSMRPAGALAAQTPDTGVIGEAHSEVQRIAVAQADASHAGAPSLVSPADLHVFEFDWAPDSKAMAYVAADPPGENNWWTARLYTERIVWSRIKFEGGVVTRNMAGIDPHIVLDPGKVAGPLHGLQIAVPRWSPGGKRIAFIGGLMSDQGVTGGDVWIISAMGGEPRDVTPGRRATPAWITWGDEDHVFANEIAGGGCRLVRLTLHGGPQVSSLTAAAGAPVFSFPGKVGDGRLEESLSTTADRSLFVFRGSTFDTPVEIYAARPGKSGTAGDALPGAEQISHFNAGVKPAWGQSVSLEWTDEGFHVQGWLTLPVKYDAAKKYPLIVEVHGGPAAAVLARWEAGGMLSASSYSALGYFVLQPNPRGSFGEGEAFTQANRRDFGYGDLRDILAGVDMVEAKYPIDANRVGITGWSYGGFMSMFALTQTQRFKAAMAGAGISDWLSYYGENSIDEWMIPFFGASVYDDPAVYAKSSAINFVKKVHTPTLLAVGDRDGECPAPQSFEFWHALRDLGVPTELVVYPNEGHGLADPDHRRDVEVRTMEWFAKYLGAS